MFRVGLRWSAGRRCAGVAVACLGSLAILVAAAPAAAGKGGKPPRSPNLLVVVTDDQRASGTMRAMPSTRKVFDRNSTRFVSAHVSTPLCCPSRSTIFSGLYAHNHGIWSNFDENLLDESRTVQRWLRRAGYRTGLIGKFLNNWPRGVSPAHWSRFWVNEGAHRAAEWNMNGEQRRIEGRSTNFIRAQARRFIRGSERRDRRPWFLYLAPSEPHGPLNPSLKYADAEFGSMKMTPAVGESDLSDKPEYLRDLVESPPAEAPGPEEVRLAQLRLLQSVDAMVRGVFRGLRRAGEVRDTLIVFTSDNGLHWGEHGGLVLKDLPYEASTHVPLLVRWPKRMAKRRPGRDRRLVSNVDLAPTLLDVARAKRHHKQDGRSLRRRGWEREHLLLEYAGLRRGGQALIPPWIALRSPDELYVEYGPLDPYEPETEYYDLTADPWELHNDPAAAPPSLFGAVTEAANCRARECP